MSMWQSGGSAVGAGIGSFVPGIGTTIGGIAGGAIGGVLGGLFGKKKRAEGTSPVTGQMQGLYAEMSNPSFGEGAIRRMASDSTPTLADFAGMAAMRGGGFAQANEQFNAARRSSQAGAFNALEQFQMNRLNARMGLLGLMDQSARDYHSTAVQERMANRATGFSFLDSALKTGGTLYAGSKGWLPGQQ